MTQGTEFTDDELSAFLDGELDPVRQKDLEAAMATDDAVLERITSMRAATDDFRAASEALLAHAPQMPELPPAQTAPAVQWRLAAASLVAGGVLTFGAMELLRPAPAVPGWKAVVANYQSLYVAETLKQNAVTSDVQMAALEALTERLGFDVRDLPEVEGLTFVRAQELGFRGRPLAQLTFLTATDAPIALCIVRTDNPTSAGIRQEEFSGLDTYSWTQDGYGILLIGPKDEPGLGAAAETFREGLAPVDT